MRNELIVLVLSVVAGVIGTGIGGVVGGFVKNKTPSAVGDMLAFAGGIMLGIVALEMIPDAVQKCTIFGKRFLGALVAFCAVCAGAGCAFLINFAIEKHDKNRKTSRLEHQKTVCLVANSDCVEILKSKSQSGLKKAGFVTFFAIAFHNIPEGMAIGASGASNLTAGILVAIIIAIHNIPEGMAITAPLVGGGVKRQKALTLAVLAGVATLVGGVIGLVVGTCVGHDGVCIMF